MENRYDDLLNFSRDKGEDIIGGTTSGLSGAEGLGSNLVAFASGSAIGQKILGFIGMIASALGFENFANKMLNKGGKFAAKVEKIDNIAHKAKEDIENSPNHGGLDINNDPEPPITGNETVDTTLIVGGVGAAAFGVLTTAKSLLANTIGRFLPNAAEESPRLSKSKWGKIAALTVAAGATGWALFKSNDADGSEVSPEGQAGQEYSFEKAVEPSLMDKAIDVLPFSGAAKEVSEHGEVTREAVVSATADGFGLVGMFKGAAIGAGAGTALGAGAGTLALPVVGTVSGGAIGGVVGGLAGAFFGETAASGAAEWAMNKLTGFFNDEANPKEAAPVYSQSAPAFAMN